MNPFRIIRQKIGELLIEKKIITEKELDTALKAQESRGGSIGQHLIHFGFATEFDIIQCLSNQYGFPYLPLNSYNIPSEVLEIIPLKFIKLYLVVPIDKTGPVLTVTMADPLNAGVVDILKKFTNCEIEVFISTYSDINLALKRYFGNRLEELDKDAITEEGDLAGEGAIQPFIQTQFYPKKERNRPGACAIELDMEYFFQDKTFQARIKNMSQIGIFFLSHFFLPVDTNIVSKINIQGNFISPVVKIVRIETINKIKRLDPHEIDNWHYCAAAVFNFISEEDKEKLLSFLKR